LTRSGVEEGWRTGTMSMFATRRNSQTIHNKIMNTRGSGTTTWYAFEDPKTGREYFHEPISDKTSWVRPTSTSSNNATHIEKAKSMSGLPQCRTVKETEGKTMDDMDTTKSQRKQRRGWGAAGVITVLSVLFFNTLFLLFLVKFLYENKTLPGQIHDQIKPPVQLHENNSDVINLSSDGADMVEIMQKEIIIEAQTDNEILNDDANKEEVEEENVRIVEEPFIVTSSPEDSGDSSSPDDVSELNCEHNPPDSENVKQEDESSNVQKEVVNVEEESAQKYNESKKVLYEKGGKKGLGAVLARKFQRLSTTVASFFNRLLRAGRRLRSGR